MSEQQRGVKARQKASWVGRFTVVLLLLVLAVAGGASYYYVMPLVGEVLEEQAAMKASIKEFGDADKALRGDIPELLNAAIQRELETLREVQSAEIRGLTEELKLLKASESRLAQQLRRAEKQLSRMSGLDQRAWRLAEAEFNVRMASQRLRVARDVKGAERLLVTADRLLAGVGNATADIVRQSVASDIAGLRALPDVDTAGLLARLNALEEQIRLLEFVVAGSFSALANTDLSADIIDGDLSVWGRALSLLSRYFVVTTIESSEMRPLPDTWEPLSQMALAAMLEQARVALLMGDQDQYGSALLRAERFIRAHTHSDDARSNSVIESLEALAATDFLPPLPDLSATLRMFRDFERAPESLAVPARVEETP